MEILRTIQFYTVGKNMPYLLIGGYALNHHGIQRQTGDIDLLVPLNTKPEWQNFLDQLGYKEFQSSKSFSRFRFKAIAGWPIDLMYVDQQTFDKLHAASQPAKFGLAQVNVVALEHLVLLKLSALKVYQEHRFLKDYTDLLALLKSKPFSKDQLRIYCEKYATLELYDRIVKDSDYD